MSEVRLSMSRWSGELSDSRRRSLALDLECVACDQRPLPARLHPWRSAASWRSPFPIFGHVNDGEGDEAGFEAGS